ncbi:hypothetical protein, partial [Escherichia coli]
DRNRSHWSTSKTPSYTKSVSWQHHRQHFAAILEVSGFKISPRFVVRFYLSTCGGFLFPATNATRDKAPATLRLTG